MFEGETLRRIIQKYSGQGPRYTSYPTAVEFSSDVTADTWEAFLKRDFAGGEQSLPASLYIHIPFCKSLCYFCACHKVILKDSGIVRPYLVALMNELEHYRRVLPDEIALEQIHWGGGSPSYLSADEIVEVYQRIESCFPIKRESADISIEVDPRTTNQEKLAAYRELGFKRLSLGVQDLSEVVQRAVNRWQPLELTSELMSQARTLGFSSLNVDLIYGLPEQSLQSFRQTIEQIIQLRPERIALYGYAHVTWLKKVQKSFERYHLPSPAERIDLFLLGLELLQDAGYIHIGMDHFARPEDSLTQAFLQGTLHRSFMGYTTHRGARLFAAGASAISCFPGIMVQNQKDLAEYIRLCQNGTFPVERGILKSADDQLRAEIIDSLFCRGVVELSEIERRWKIHFWSYFAELREQLSSFQADNLLTVGADAIDVTAMGRLFVRNIAMLFDKYLPAQLRQSRSVYSATI